MLAGKKTIWMSYGRDVVRAADGVFGTLNAVIRAGKNF